MEVLRFFHFLVQICIVGSRNGGGKHVGHLVGTETGKKFLVQHDLQKVKKQIIEKLLSEGRWYSATCVNVIPGVTAWGHSISISICSSAHLLICSVMAILAKKIGGKSA